MEVPPPFDDGFRAVTVDWMNDSKCIINTPLARLLLPPARVLCLVFYLETCLK